MSTRTETMPLSDDEVAYLVGRGGQTKFRLENFSLARLNIDKDSAELMGTDDALERARLAIKITLQQRNGGRIDIDFQDMEDRKDVETLDVPVPAVGFLLGSKGATLRKMEEKHRVFMFFDNDRKRDGKHGPSKRLYIVGPDRARDSALEESEEVVNYKMGTGGGRRPAIVDNRDQGGRGGPPPRYDDHGGGGTLTTGATTTAAVATTSETAGGATTTATATTTAGGMTTAATTTAATTTAASATATMSATGTTTGAATTATTAAAKRRAERGARPPARTSSLRMAGAGGENGVAAGAAGPGAELRAGTDLYDGGSLSAAKALSDSLCGVSLLWTPHLGVGLCVGSGGGLGAPVARAVSCCLWPVCPVRSHATLVSPFPFFCSPASTLQLKKK
eukprot:CAMPEP_0185284340 /NCGR_PEP_ID=MMETSP1363-20130426/1026_1 /TAXON_ID=38817 /ORGANISM="Gephyrocapsa oceanica, Strain RCC1303" /LENGTH=392 /DNA_ID=CAMNT_0027880049 /DNA_START=63 /DNA_END=1239 /DNA_ORIENTATION=-